MAELFTNNAFSVLAASVAASDTSIAIQATDGAKFPNPSAPDFFRFVLYKKSTGEWEICICTSRSGDTLATVLRAQEGTAAISLNANDVIELRPTAAFFSSLNVTSVNIQENAFSSSVESGVADAYVITPSPAISAYGFGQEFWFIPTNDNTGGSCTLSVNGISSPQNIKLINGTDPYQGALTAGRLAHVYHDGTDFVLLDDNRGAATAAEIDYNAGLTPGIAQANKSMVLSSDGNIDYGKSITIAGADVSSVELTGLVFPPDKDVELDFSVQSSSITDGAVLVLAINGRAPVSGFYVANRYTNNGVSGSLLGTPSLVDAWSKNDRIVGKVRLYPNSVLGEIHYTFVSHKINSGAVINEFSGGGYYNENAVITSLGIASTIGSNGFAAGSRITAKMN